MSLRQLVIDRWGTTAEFYKEQERFMKVHNNTQCIMELDNELEMPTKAVYTFPPLQVAWEHLELMRKLREVKP